MPSRNQRPLTSAERARKYRERKRAELAAAAANAEPPRDDERDDEKPTPPPPRIQMRASVAAALEAMKWLKDSDKAATDLALMIADQIDWQADADPTATGRIASLSHALMRALHEIGGTPTVRLQHELRSLRVAAGLDPESGTNDSKQAGDAKPRPGEATVTSIKRPPKRKRPA
jgi:hypothetical protein